MVGFFTLFQDTYHKFELQAEIDVLNQDLINRQKVFGVQLYDLIEKQRRASRASIELFLRENNGRITEGVRPEDLEGFFGVFQSVFQTIKNEIREPLEICKRDIDLMESLATPPFLIEKRKEDFGVEIWPDVSQRKWLLETLNQDFKTALDESDGDIRCGSSNENSSKDLGDFMSTAIHSVVKGTQNSFYKAIGRLSPEECEIEALLDAAMSDVKVYEDQKAQKFSEIERLVLGGTTLECCV